MRLVEAKRLSRRSQALQPLSALCQVEPRLLILSPHALSSQSSSPFRPVNFCRASSSLVSRPAAKPQLLRCGATEERRAPRNLSYSSPGIGRHRIGKPGDEDNFDIARAARPETLGCKGRRNLRLSAQCTSLTTQEETYTGVLATGTNLAADICQRGRARPSAKGP